MLSSYRDLERIGEQARSSLPAVAVGIKVSVSSQFDAMHAGPSPSVRMMLVDFELARGTAVRRRPPRVTVGTSAGQVFKSWQDLQGRRSRGEGSGDLAGDGARAMVAHERNRGSCGADALPEPLAHRLIEPGCVPTWRRALIIGTDAPPAGVPSSSVNPSLIQDNPYDLRMSRRGIGDA